MMNTREVPWPFWTTDELATMMDFYPELGIAGLLKSNLLPGRTRAAIKGKAAGLGLDAKHLRPGGGVPECNKLAPLPTMDEWQRKECADFSAAMRAMPVFGSLGARL